MRIFSSSQVFGLAALLALWNWSLPPRASLAVDKPVKVHILYSSDATGYHEPCG